jgi:Alpha-L-fucosidase
MALSIRSRVVWLIILCSAMNAVTSLAEDRAAWLREARFGVMTHYLADWIARREDERPSVERWNELVDNFDVEALAEQLDTIGARYYLITIGQNSGYYLSPNATYDRFVGREPSRCSRRDLVADLHVALHKRNIPLMVYLPAGAPSGDREAREKLQWQSGPHPNREFQAKWEQVIREWSVRWGDKVVGWWFDGCYWPNTMYRDTTPPNFESFAAAARAGNPKSIVAFNPGVFARVFSMTPQQDYTAGEINDVARIEIKRQMNGKLDGTQIHILSFLGERWGMGEPRFATDDVVHWSRDIWGYDGAFTWDVPIQSNGTIAEPFVAQLKAVGAAARKK